MLDAVVSFLWNYLFWMQLRAAGASLRFHEIAVAISTAGVALPVPGRANTVQPGGRFDGARTDRAASFACQLPFRIPLSHRSGGPLLELWDPSSAPTP